MEIIMQLSVGRQKINAEKVVYYRSRDLQEYTYCGVFAESDGSIGNMWECPNFVQIGNTDVLIISQKDWKKKMDFLLRLKVVI